MALLWVVALLPFADGSNPDPVPVDDDVTAGWTALLVFVGLIIAVVVLGRSLVGYGGRRVAVPDEADVSPEPPSAAPR